MRTIQQMLRELDAKELEKGGGTITMTDYSSKDFEVCLIIYIIPFILNAIFI